MAPVPAHMDSNPTGLSLALDALEGLSVGDALGEQFFARPRLAVERRVPRPPWPWTDDTNMALSILEILMEHGSIDCDALATSFGRRYDPARGYGTSMHQVLRAIASGEPWRAITAAQFGGQGSFGNGAAMRVAPLGAWFAGDVDRIVEEALKSAAVTHAHPEAAAGAVAVAVAAGIAASTRSHPALVPEEFLRAVHERVPAGEVATRLLDAIALPPKTSGQHAAHVLGSGAQVSAQDTVPFAIWSAAQTPDDFPDTFWRTVSGLGDRDTTCAIACGIVASRIGVGGIPTAWRTSREALPAWVTATSL